MKKLSKLALILFMLVTAVFAVTACGSVEEIKIDRNSEQPQTTYVVGTELNRSKGAILASGGSEAVPFSDPAVEISGYDKNTVGKQTLTITYMGASTTYTIEVVPRMEANGFNYFVGEPFEAGKAKLKINNDNGSSTVVNSDDPNLKIEGFDSSKPASPIKVKATYQSEEMKEEGIEPFTGEIDVNIYEVANNGGKGELHRPTKIAYESHELEVNTSGGYFTLESANKELTRTVQITPEMITGFDMGVAKVENMETPVSEDLTINYAGYKFTYTIEITFSDVSLVKLRAKELNETHSWASGAPTVSDEDGKLAREMADLFLTLSEARQQFVSQEEFCSLARYAAIYEKRVWDNALKEYHFTVKNSTLVPSFASVEEAEADLAKLAGADGKINPENELYKLSEDLMNFLLAFYNYRFINGQSIGAYLDSVCLPTELEKVTLFIPVMKNLYESMQDVKPEEGSAKEGEQYDLEYLKSKAESIDKAYDILYGTAQSGLFTGQVPSDREYFKTVNNWREKKDLYDIIYYYYLHKVLEAGEGADQTDVQKLGTLPNFVLPGLLEDYWIAYMNAYTVWSQITNVIATVNQGKDAVPVDNTTFFYYYDKAYEIVDKIEKSDDQLCKDLYIQFQLGGSLLNMKGNNMTKQGRIQSVGYVQLRDSYYHDPQVDKLWENYMKIVEKNMTDPGYGATADYSKDIEAVFTEFMNMTPSRQRSFLSSMDLFYVTTGQPRYLMSFSEIYVYFVKLIADYYGDLLPGNAYAGFQYLMLAVEDYASHYDDEEFLDGFKENMENAKTTYALMSAEEKSAFDQYVGKYYQNYLSIYEGRGYSDYGEWQDEIDEVKGLVDTTLAAMDTIMRMIQQSQGGSMESNPFALFPALAASFERATAIVDDIFANAPENVRNKFSYEETTITGFEIPCSIDYAFSNARSAYMTLLSQEIDDIHTMLMDGYFGAGFDKLLVEGYSAIINQFYNLTQQDDRSEEFNKESILKAIDIYFDLDIETRVSYLMMFDSMDLFAGGVQTYFGTSASGMNTMKDAVSQIFKTETAYILWYTDHDGSNESGLDYKSAFVQAQKALKEEYDKLTGTDKETFDKHFGKGYKFFEDNVDDVQNYVEPEE